MTSVLNPEVRVARLAELNPATLYRILQLRVDVFVVEQQCPYAELDGRDLEPETLHVWVEDGDAVPSYLRVLASHDGTRRIGRVVTAADSRGQGLAELLIRRALELCGSAPVVLDAQSHLERWYERLGFRRSGADFDEDGIPHVPMTLAK